MEKLFYDDRKNFPDGESFIRRIATEFYGLPSPTLRRTENGKPYFPEETAPSLFFSVSHTEKYIFAAFSDENVGVDAEDLSRNVDYPPVLGRFPPSEREAVHSAQDFLRLWTAKESVIKWLDGKLFRDLKKIEVPDAPTVAFISDGVLYEKKPLGVSLCRLTLNGHVVTLCKASEGQAPDVVNVSLALRFRTNL